MLHVRMRTLLAAAALLILLAACAQAPNTAQREMPMGGDQMPMGAGEDMAGDHGGDGMSHQALAAVNEPVAGAPEITVTAVDIDFRPERLELTAGEPINVTVVNAGATLHDFTLPEAGVHANVEPGEETITALVVDEAGTYQAVCTVAGHAEAGMVIEIVVT